MSANLKLLVLAMGLIAAILGYLGYDRFAKSHLVFGTPTDARQLLQAASRDGAVLVRTLGGALGASAEALNARAVERLRAGIAEPWLRLETDAAKTQSAFVLTFLFDGPSDTRPNFAALCAGTLQPQHPQTKDINVYAVLCGPNGPVVGIQGWTKRPATADAPELDRLIEQVGLSALRGNS